MYDLVITNGKLVTPDRIYEADIAVKDGVYAAFLAKGSQAAAKEVIDAYVTHYRHGISCVDAVGGYSKKSMNLLHTVVSSYEVQDIVDLMREVDSNIIVNVVKTENFFGGFYQSPID